MITANLFLIPLERRLRRRDPRISAVRCAIRCRLAQQREGRSFEQRKLDQRRCESTQEDIGEPFRPVRRVILAVT